MEGRRLGNLIARLRSALCSLAADELTLTNRDNQGVNTFVGKRLVEQRLKCLAVIDRVVRDENAARNQARRYRVIAGFVDSFFRIEEAETNIVKFIHMVEEVTLYELDYISHIGP